MRFVRSSTDAFVQVWVLRDWEYHSQAENHSNDVHVDAITVCKVLSSLDSRLLA